MKGYSIIPIPTKDQMWMIPEVTDGNTHFLGVQASIAEHLPRGQDTLVAFNVDKRVYIETFHTVEGVNGMLFITGEEMEKHL